MFFPSSGPLYCPWIFPSMSTSWPSSTTGSRNRIARLWSTAHAPTSTQKIRSFYLYLKTWKCGLIWEIQINLFPSPSIHVHCLYICTVPMTVQTLSGVIRISAWRTWNRLFHQPKARSIVTLVLEWAELNRSWAGVDGLRYGVIR